MEEGVTIRTSYFGLFYTVLFSVLGYFVYGGIERVDGSVSFMSFL